MTQLTIPVQGIFDLSNNQLVFNFSNISQIINNQNYSISLPQSNKQEAWISPVSQQPTFIQKHGLRACSSALGVAGCISLVVSCICSVLIPAIGSVGVIGIACLVNRKITPLNAKGLSPVATKSQSVFEKEVTNKAENLLNVPIQSNLLKSNPQEPKIPPPPPPPPPSLEQDEIDQKKSSSLGNFRDGSLSNAYEKTELKPAANIKKTEQRPNLDSRSSLLSSIREGVQLKKPVDIQQPPPPSKDSREELLSNIRKGEIKLRPTLNLEKIKETIKQLSPNFLLKILQSAYEGALVSCEDGKNQNLKTYFEKKIKNLKDKVILKENQNLAVKNPDIEVICKQVKNLSLSKSMGLIKDLLDVLSNHEDLKSTEKQYYSEKLAHIKTHIKKLESPGNPIAVTLLKRADVMRISDHSDIEDSDTDETKVNSEEWDE